MDRTDFGWEDEDFGFEMLNMRRLLDIQMEIFSRQLDIEVWRSDFWAEGILLRDIGI